MLSFGKDLMKNLAQKDEVEVLDRREKSSLVSVSNETRDKSKNRKKSDFRSYLS